MISDKEEKEEKKKEKQKTEGCKGGKKTRKKLWFANFWQHVVIYEVYWSKSSTCKMDLTTFTLWTFALQALSLWRLQCDFQFHPLWVALGVQIFSGDNYLFCSSGNCLGYIFRTFNDNLWFKVPTHGKSYRSWTTWLIHWSAYAAWFQRATWVGPFLEPAEKIRKNQQRTQILTWASEWMKWKNSPRLWVCWASKWSASRHRACLTQCRRRTQMQKEVGRHYHWLKLKKRLIVLKEMESRFGNWPGL